ncbi:MAG: hypothetical protein GY808_19045 [Gammaproteobacteria bacterium]|nr:hypothetical protein [Gammaproteobacteria bacterium]
MIMFILRNLFLILIFLHLASCAGRIPDSSQTSIPLPVIWSDDALKAFEQGVSLLKSHPDKAASAFNVAIKHAPKMEAAYYNLGLLYYSDAKDKNKQQQLEQLITDAENQGVLSARLMNLLSVNLRKQGKFLEAEANYILALTLEPNHLSTLANMAILQDLYLGQLTRALEYYKRYQQQLKQQEKEDNRINNWLADLQQRIKKQNKETG